MACNFRKKKGHRVGWARFARKKGLDSPSLHLTLTWHAIFVKKQVIGAGGLASLAKKDWIHQVYV